MAINSSNEANKAGSMHVKQSRFLDAYVKDRFSDWPDDEKKIAKLFKE